MHSLWLILVTCFVSFSNADEAAFDSAIQEVRTHLQQSDWAAAKERLLAVLGEHEPADYVRIRRPEIVEILQRCAVRQAVPAPPPRDVISGKLRSYNERTGRIALTYGTDLADFEPSGGILIHPLHFIGNSTIELSGKEYPREPPSVFFCIQEDTSYQVNFGMTEESDAFERWIPSIIAQSVAGKHEEVSNFEKPPLTPGKKWNAKIVVSATQVTIHANRKKLHTLKKSRDVWGQLGFADLPSDTTIQIDGKVNASWIRGVVDEAVREQDRQFLSSYDVDERLPEWLRGDAAGVPAAGTDEAKPELYPWRVNPAQQKNVENVERVLSQDSPRAAVQLVKSLTAAPAGAFPSDMRRYLLALAQLQAGPLEPAEEAARQLSEQYEGFSAVHMLHASLLEQLGRSAEALISVERAIKAAPRNAQGHLARCNLLLSLGRLDEARTAVRECRRLGLSLGELGVIEAMITRADNGPDWVQRVDHATDHYRIATDLAKRNCVAAGKTLEKMYSVLSEQLGANEDDQFQVYLFSGEAGYREYTTQAFPSFSHSTAGMYSTALKQLVIWNLPDRESVEHTLRHECVHQYLDARGTFLPRWFEEGYAEYLSYVRENRRGEIISVGEAYQPYVRLLLTNPNAIVPLAEFVQLNGEAFYQIGDIADPQAWAVVHFLFHHPEHKAVPQTLLSNAKDGLPAEQSLAQALEGIDLDALHREFLGHLQTVGRGE